MDSKLQPQEFYENYWHNKSAEIDADVIWKAKMLLSVIPAKQFPVVVELGCGAGGVLSMVATRLDSTYQIGLELAKGAIKQIEGNYPLVMCLQGDVTSLPFKEGAIDLIILSDILEHVPEPMAVMKEVCSVSRYVALNIPIEKSILPRLFSKFKGIKNPVEERTHMAGHLFEWTRKDISRMLKGIGINVNKCLIVNPPGELFKCTNPKRKLVIRLTGFLLVNMEKISALLSNNLHARLFHAKYFAFAECNNGS